MADYALVCQGTLRSGQPCRNTLGTVTDGLLTIKHRHRTSAGLAITERTRLYCEDCGAMWTPAMLDQRESIVT